MKRATKAPKATPADKPNVLAPDKQYSSLSLLDLLEAREHYHIHLLHKENVVATAIGRYRIRKSHPWPSSGHKPKRTETGPKTLDNSEIRDYSWPCVLVFVDRWVEPDEFHTKSGAAHPEDLVPSSLYLPDGRVIPVCVIEAPLETPEPAPVAAMEFPSNLLGGGFPLLLDVQGQEHLASVGCMVTDGHRVYALTNHHVTGSAGEPIYSLLGGQRVQVGRAAAKQLTRLSFSDVYPTWPGKSVFLHLDIGLVEVDDVTRWTADVFGIGRVGRLADLSVENLTLRLIGCPVRAYGCASRAMQGEIAGLFYRYKAVGGFEYVSDFLIGPRGNMPLRTGPGDSGTLWLLESPTEPLPLPLAVQWGAHLFAGDAGRTQIPYALATCLSTVCNLLEMDVVPDLNSSGEEVWGMVGHYTIATAAMDFIRDSKLRQLMKANLERISFEAVAITHAKLAGLSNHPFIPLADVPDLVWKRGHFSRGQPEHPNHFADMDKPRPDDGQTLLDLCKGKPQNVAVDVWADYYTAVGDKSRGLLPFRVWQIFNTMVEAVADGDAARFVCAAGILSHYVGDACQPLHISYMFNGIPQADGSILGEGVHSAYEDNMVDRHAAEIQNGIEKAQGHGTGLQLVQSGHEAAVAVVALMQKTFDTIEPRDIVNTFVQASGGPAHVADALAEKFLDDTIKVMVEGSRCLAMLWDSAWKQGSKNGKITDLDAVDEDDLAKLYQSKTFLPSRTLDQIKPLLK